MRVITTDLGGDVTSIDTQMGGYEGITSGYLIRSSRPALIETGTALSAPLVVESLATLGLGPADLATIVLTHIHLDHAGGVGDIARAFPNARVVVHERGARHLVDPTRLMASASAVFGDSLRTLFGHLMPVDSERLDVLGAADTIDLGDSRTLASWHAPGHASHHVGLLDSETGDLYTGDAAGIYIPEFHEVRPATPPPDFDLDLALASIARMADIKPQRLLFSHFGPVTDVDATLAASADVLHRWVERVRDTYNGGMDLDHAIAMLTERINSEREQRLTASPNEEDVNEKFEVLSSIEANTAGVWKWLQKSEGSPK